MNHICEKTRNCDLDLTDSYTKSSYDFDAFRQ